MDKPLVLELILLNGAEIMYVEFDEISAICYDGKSNEHYIYLKRNPTKILLSSKSAELVREKFKEVKNIVRSN